IVISNGGTLRFTTGLPLSAKRGMTIGSPAGSGTATIDVFSDSNPAQNTAPTILTSSYGGVIADSGTGADGLSKIGFGNLTLFGANTYTGTTAIKNGGLTLDFTQATAPAANIISGSSQLLMGGANSGLGNTSYSQLTVLGKASASTSQSFTNALIDVGP